MSIAALPPDIGYASLSLELRRNVAVFESPIDGTIRRSARGGDRWAATINFPTTHQHAALRAATFFDQISRGNRWTYLPVPPTQYGDAWTPGELLTNGSFMDGLNGWSTVAEAYASNGRLWLKKISSTDPHVIQTFGGVESGKPLALLADMLPGGDDSWHLFIRDTNNALLASVSYTSSTRGCLSYTPSSSANLRAHLVRSGGAIGTSNRWANASCARCLLVNGANQSGTKLKVDGGPNSTLGALRMGRFLTVQLSTLEWQLVRLVEDFNTDSAGAGTLLFEPALRASPSDNAPVIVHQPFVRMYMPEHASVQDLRPPMLSGFSFDLVEDVTPP